MRQVALLICFLLLPSALAVAAQAPYTEVATSAFLGPLTLAQSMATASAQTFWVTDPRNSTVTLMATDTPLRSHKVARTPLSIADAGNGQCLVGLGTRVARLDENGRELSSFGSFRMTGGITRDEQGQIYVVDSLARTVSRFNDAGVLLGSFGARGSGPGQFQVPTGILYEPKRQQLLVADTANGRIQVFSKSGTFIRSLGSQGAGPLQFTAPVALAVDYDQNGAPSRLYVLDSYQGTVSVLDLADSGGFLGYIGSYGSGAGQLVNPGGMLLLDNRVLLIANSAGHINRYLLSNSVGPDFPLTIDTTTGATDQALYAIQGKAPSGASVKLSLNGASAISAQSSDQRWSANLLLVPGYNAITAFIPGYSASATVLLTTSGGGGTPTTPGTTTPAPIMSVSGLASGSVTGEQVQNFSAVTAGATSVTVNGVAAVLDQGTFSVPYILSVGENQILISAKGADGQISEDRRTIVFRPDAPLLTISTPADNSVTDSQLITVDGKTSPGAQVKVNDSWLNSDAATGSYSLSVPLNEGQNTIEVEAVLADGSKNRLKRTLSYRPAGHSTSIAAPDRDTATSAAAVTVVADATQPPAPCSFNGAPCSVAAVNGRYQILLPQLAPGINRLSLGAGSDAAAKRNIYYLPDAPAVTLQAEQPNSNRFAGTSSDSAIVTLRDKNGPLPMAQSGGSWSANLDGVSYDRKSLEAIAISPAGVAALVALFTSPGDLDGDGRLTLPDVLRALRIATGQESASATEIERSATGNIDLVEVVSQLRRLVGLTGGK